MSRPAWTVTEAAERTGVSSSTLRRAVRAERVAGAYKDAAGTWRLPIEGLIAAGYPPRTGAVPEDLAQPAVSAGEDLAQRVRDLEADLRVVRAEKAAAELIAHAHEQRAEAAERALRLLEGRPSSDQPGLVTDHGHDQPMTNPPPRSWWSRLLGR